MSVGHSTVQLPSGSSLEYELSPPLVLAHSQETSHNKLAVCLHPWSWLGGRMDDPVLHMLVRPLQQEGYHVLRYNSRGVGKSTGWASLTGSREAQDLNELVQWAITTLTSVAAVAVIGYSYGSLISSLFPVLPDIKTDHILISYPVGPRHWLTAFRGRAYATALQTLLINSAARVLILYGTQDEFTSVETYGGWAGSLEEHAKGAERNFRIVKIEGATHFWREHEQADKMVEEIVQWVH